MTNKPLPDSDLEETITAPPLALSLLWKGEQLVELRARWAKDVNKSGTLSDAAQQLKNALTRYVAGNAPSWPDLPYDFSRLSEFQQAAIHELQRIPCGETRTYGQLAAIIGRPQGAQALGQAMGANPFPIVYPCHRVIASDGKLTGFSAEGGLVMKEHLLRHEGALPPQQGRLF